MLANCTQGHHGSSRHAISALFCRHSIARVDLAIQKNGVPALEASVYSYYEIHRDLSASLWRSLERYEGVIHCECVYFGATAALLTGSILSLIVLLLPANVDATLYAAAKFLGYPETSSDRRQPAHHDLGLAQ